MDPKTETSTWWVLRYYHPDRPEDFVYAKDSKQWLEIKIQKWRRYFNCRYLAETLLKFGQHLLFIPVQP